MSVQSALDYIHQLRKERQPVFTLIDPTTNEHLVLNTFAHVEGDNRGYTIMCNHFYIILNGIIAHLMDEAGSPNTSESESISGTSHGNALNNAPNDEALGEK